MQELLLSNGNKLPVIGLGTDDVFYLRKLVSCIGIYRVVIITF